MNIYVSHLSWGTSSEGLGNLFMQFGEVASANVITDRETGRSRGFGFVEMPNEEEVQNGSPGERFSPCHTERGGFYRPVFCFSLFSTRPATSGKRAKNYPRDLCFSRKKR